MKKPFFKFFVAVMAISMMMGMGTTSFAAGLSVNGGSQQVNPHSSGQAVHWPNGDRIDAYSDPQEYQSLRPYFESLVHESWLSYDLLCGGVFKLDVGESVTLHMAQLEYVFSKADTDIRGIAYSDPDGLVAVEAGGLQKYDGAYCRPYTFTGQKDGTFVFLYQSGPMSMRYYKIVVGTGDSSSSPAKEPEQETKTPKEDASVSAEQAVSASPAASAGDLTHTVQLGDTFGCLALNYFGDMTVWPAIYSYNAKAIESARNQQIYVGMPILIPNAIQDGEKNIYRIAPAVAGTGEELYTVQPGDSYASIALNHFGDMSRYQEIFDRNSDRLKDINTLYAGQVLVLPQK